MEQVLVLLERVHAHFQCPLAALRGLQVHCKVLAPPIPRDLAKVAPFVDVNLPHPARVFVHAVARANQHVDTRVGVYQRLPLVQIVELSDNPYILYGIARVLCYLTFHEPNLRPMVEEDAVGAFARICEKLPSIQDAKRGEDGEEDHFWELGQIICLTIRLLTCSNGGQDKMLKDGVVSSCCCCWRPLQTKCGC